MKCRCCDKKPFPRPSARGLCLGHALLFLWSPWATVEEFILKRRES